MHTWSSVEPQPPQPRADEEEKEGREKSKRVRSLSLLHLHGELNTHTPGANITLAREKTESTRGDCAGDELLGDAKGRREERGERDSRRPLTDQPPTPSSPFPVLLPTFLLLIR